jgi:hypothetical protein
VDSLIPEFQDRVVFIVADLQTPQGEAFAIRNNVPNTVLVFFDGQGQRIETIYGVQEERELRGRIKRILGFR